MSSIIAKLFKYNAVLFFYVLLLSVACIAVIFSSNRKQFSFQTYDGAKSKINRISRKNARATIKYSKDAVLVVITSMDQSFIDSLFSALSYQVSQLGKPDSKKYQIKNHQGSNFKSHSVQRLNNGILIKLPPESHQVINKLIMMNQFLKNSSELSLSVKNFREP